MTTTSKVLIVLGSLVAAGGTGWGVFHFGTWEVSKGRHRDWDYKVTRNKGEYATSVGRVGFGTEEIGKYATKGEALEAAITYIDQKSPPAVAESAFAARPATAPMGATAGFDNP